MEADAKEPSGVTRGQNVVQVMPSDWSAAESVLSSLVERIEPAVAETQVLVVTPDAESAAAGAQAIVSAAGDRAITVLAVSSSPRAGRLLRAAPSQVIVGAPSELVALLQSSALKPAGVRVVVFAWLEPILETSTAAPLETLLGELPKEAARTVLAAELTPAYEALIERYARRARRAVESVAEGSAPLSAEYVATSPAARGSTFRRFMDALDLPRAEVYARSEPVRTEAITIARSLGYPSDAVRLAGGQGTSGDPLLLLELPASRDELRRLVGTQQRRVYAFVQPSQLGSLRALLGGGVTTPVAMIEAAERARGKDSALRASLRDVLTSGDVRREVLALEPLLAEFDGLEIAAAALRMLEQQRPARRAEAAVHAGPMQRLFLNLGEKDGIRAQEIISAVTTEAGIPGSQVGRVEVRDTHTIVEVAAAVAELVVGKLGGAVVRGRKVQARVDQPKEDRPARVGPAREGAARSRPFERDRGERPARPARPFDRGERPARPSAPRSGPPRGGPPRGAGASDRPTRPFNREGGPVRKLDRDGGNARPTRPRPPRDDA